MRKKVILFIIIGGILIFSLIQLIPYGRQHTNPPVISEPSWDSPETRQLVVRACYACHSNQTIWPWYSHVAPVSWLLQYDVDEGRQTMNFSEWERKSLYAETVVNVIQSGEMPPFQYLIMHPEARLSQTEKELLLKGILASLEKRDE